MLSTFTAVGLNHLKTILADNHIGEICMENHEEIISRLKFIGYIQKDEKINVRLVNRQSNTLMTKLSRTIIYPDNRENTLKFVKNVMARSFDILDQFRHQNKLLAARSLISDLLKARQGMLNLKYTYADDTKFCCDMDVIIEQIGSKITFLQHLHPDLFKDLETDNETMRENVETIVSSTSPPSSSSLTSTKNEKNEKNEKSEKSEKSGKKKQKDELP
jgi:hypothetical protein